LQTLYVLLIFINAAYIAKFVSCFHNITLHVYSRLNMITFTFAYL